MSTKKSIIPANAKRITIRPLALGESTGHHHCLIADPDVDLEQSVEMYEHSDNGDVKTYLRVNTDGVSICHVVGDRRADHFGQRLAPGEYEVTIQQEITDWGRQNVID